MNSKSKIGIITLHGYFNYGNRLQNNALKYTIEKLGYEVDTVIIESDKNEESTERFKSLTFKKIVRALSRRIIPSKRKERSEEIKITKERTQYFKEYSERNLSEKTNNLSSENSQKFIDGYSYFITGSDQVWNPVEYDKLPVFFLTFTDKRKRLSYAPSISLEELPKGLEEEYKDWLEGISTLSIREEAGAKIIKRLTGRDAPVLVDPTMLLTKQEWLSFSKRASNRPDTPYLLTYFLGGPTDETRKKLQKIANEKRMTIINLGDITDKETYKTGPSEFLDYINNASAFFTDSFHGVVFSIIFQTPFIVYERISSGPSMYSRIETILDKFTMRNREAKGFNEDIFSMNFSGTNEVLEREYEKSINYLKDALRIEE